MLTASRGLSPVKRESRPAFVAQRLPMICQLGGDGQKDSTDTLRHQRLSVLGIAGTRALLLSRLVWGERA
jgi:hypothetical protein